MSVQEKLSAMDRTALFDTLFCHLSCGEISGKIADRMKSGARLSFIKISVNFKGCLNKPLACSFSLSNNGHRSRVIDGWPVQASGYLLEQGVARGGRTRASSPETMASDGAGASRQEAGTSP